jgi:hypothetical protein
MRGLGRENIFTSNTVAKRHSSPIISRGIEAIIWAFKEGNRRLLILDDQQ